MLTIHVKAAVEDGIFFGYSSRHVVVTSGGGNGTLSSRYIVRAMELPSGRELYRNDTLLVKTNVPELLEWDDAISKVEEERACGRGSFSRGAVTRVREPSVPRRPEESYDPTKRVEPEYRRTPCRRRTRPRLLLTQSSWVWRALK